jgi:ATP-binding cassette subfamily A (ABC1) protein 3
MKYKEMVENNRTIQIKNLYKTFNGDFHAVNNLSMTMYSDQIFVLLGHNGAGKTTTISMLTGMIESTSGTIEILGSTKL